MLVFAVLMEGHIIINQMYTLEKTALFSFPVKDGLKKLRA